MNIVSNLISWITNNWTTIVELYLAIVGLASIIVKITPTLKDDDALKGIIKFLGKYVALNTDKGKSTPNA